MPAVTFVTIVDPSGTGGDNIATRETIAAFARHDAVDLTLVCPRPGGRLPAEITDNVTSLRLLASESASGSPAWHLGVELQTVRQFVKVLRHDPPDLLVSRLAPSMFVTPLVARLLDVPFVLLIRGMVLKNRPDDRTRFPAVVKRVVKLNADTADRIYVAFEEIETELLDPLGKEYPVEVFPNAVDPGRFPEQPIAEARSTLDLPFDADAFVVGFVGTIARRHRLPTLIRGVDRVTPADADIRVLIVGDGPERATVAGLVSALDLESRVVFTGEVPHDAVSTYIAACDVMYGVVDPERPSNPIKNYESLACARPVITTEAKEFAFIEAENAGIRIDAVSPDAVSEALDQLVGLSCEERLAMGQRGRAYVLKHHTWDRLVEEVLSSTRMRSG